MLKNMHGSYLGRASSSTVVYTEFRLFGGGLPYLNLYLSKPAPVEVRQSSVLSAAENCYPNIFLGQCWNANKSQVVTSAL